MLRAYLVVVFGDIPAVLMLMHMKGHNGISPCRMCSIQGVRAPDGKTYYVPHASTRKEARVEVVNLPL